MVSSAMPVNGAVHLNVSQVQSQVASSSMPSSVSQSATVISKCEKMESHINQSVATSTVPPVKRTSDNRRSNKPIMEKRRRARINNCLNELKTLILDAMKKDPARHSKLEKADILEMTVKHLQNLQRQQAAISAATDPAVLNKFRAGFSECALEVGRFPGLDPIVKRRLLQHLAGCLNQNSINGQIQETQPQQVQVHIVPGDHLVEHAVQNNGIIVGNGVHLLPTTRLPNGEIALVLPHGAASNMQQQVMQQQVLLQVPHRTASTTSASSSSYSPSPSHSPEPLVGYEQNKPLSLVVRKEDRHLEEEKPWRPW